jgi:ABC-type transport system substrate-binding protein
MSDEKKSDEGIPRRSFLTGAGAAGTAAAALALPQAKPAEAQQTPAAGAASDPRAEPPLILNPVFPHNGGYNPTGTVGALAYWSARAITQDYLKNPGPLVRA